MLDFSKLSQVQYRNILHFLIALLSILNYIIDIAILQDNIEKYDRVFNMNPVKVSIS